MGTNSRRSAERTTRQDLGLETVERAYEAMSIDREWSVREPRGFTWWGHWLRQRIWAGPAVRSRGETLWHVRARTPIFRDVPDEPAAYELLGSLNALGALSATVYDPEDRTISSRCGAFLYGDVVPWLRSYLLLGVALQASFAWRLGPDLAEGRRLDDEPHPQAGPRHDPDDMLNAAGALKPAACPFTPRVLKRAARVLASEGLPAQYETDDGTLQVLLPTSEDAAAVWILGSAEHPVLGPGALLRLVVPPVRGPRRGRWLANALNLAEAADWRGEDRPHGLGSWVVGSDALTHLAFLPSSVLGRPGAHGSLVAVQNFLAWGAVRARFAGERLPWLEAAAASRYPLDEPGDPDDPEEEGPAGVAGDPEASEDPEASVPVAQRSFGPASRSPRPRDRLAERRAPRELVVDPADEAAFAEIDAAVATAEDGDRIVVRPGTYRVPVVVDRAVRIEGQGPVEDIVLEPVGGEALGIAASGAHVQGLTIRPARAGNDGGLYSAVAFHDAGATIEGCHLSSHLGATVWVAGPSSDARLEGCTLVDGAQNAIWVSEEGRAQMQACHISGHRWPIIVGGPHASLVVRDSEVVDNLDHGIVGAERATLVVEGCTIARNAVSGVLLLAAAPSSRVEGCTIEENGGTGVFVEGGRGRIQRNVIRGNDVGIAVMGGGAPTIRDNEIAENRLGLGVRGSGAAPRVSSNTISASRAEGVIVDESGAGRFEANTVTGSGGAGIWVDDEGTAPRFAGNHVNGSAVGVMVTEGAGGEFRSNDLRGNTRGSWHLDSPGALSRADNLEDAGVLGAALAGQPPDPAGPGAPPTRMN